MLVWQSTPKIDATWTCVYAEKKSRVKKFCRWMDFGIKITQQPWLLERSLYCPTKCIIHSIIHILKVNNDRENTARWIEHASSSCTNNAKNSQYFRVKVSIGSVVYVPVSWFYTSRIHTDGQVNLRKHKTNTKNYYIIITTCMNFVSGLLEWMLAETH